MKPSRHPHHRRSPHVSGRCQALRRRTALLVSVLVLLAVMAWSHRPTLVNLHHGWGTDDYSASQLVPIVALFLVWRERETLKACPLTPCWIGGVALLVLGEAVRGYGYLSALASIERISLILTVASLVLLVAGWRALRRLMWILLFLVLMVPLPGRVHNLISLPLQRMATTGAVFVLEAFGVRVSQQGNVVVLNDNTSLAVAEACSGLRMLTAFIIVAAFIAYMVRRARWQKAVLLASSLPLAVICNVLRIVATAILMLHVSSEVADKFFHDFAGYVMMPAAVLLLFGEIWLMDRIIVPEPEPENGSAKTVWREKSAVRTGVEST